METFVETDYQQLKNSKIVPSSNILEQDMSCLITEDKHINRFALDGEDAYEKSIESIDKAIKLRNK